ncbi:hypothetical protein DFH08DRAFT_951546 [Mycena albidolilacea]|uniref:Uncharacterized protein n=1 Tax=Mycena albidolilacea TaxID=1033008 RepID=A0AAD7F232_9AGAR|nr:hypothetical protein DFH08DRAFT_951546 [Mycena albidolilacea]
MPPKTTYNENISGSFSLGHIKLFRAYSAQLNGNTNRSLDIPVHYDDWYVGPIPGLKKNKLPAQDTPTDSKGFLLRFTINQLELSNKQADINNHASEALFESGIRAVQCGCGCGHHLKHFQNHRAIDTYYGTSMDDTCSHGKDTSERSTLRQRSRSVDTANVPGTKHGRSASAEERSVCPRHDTDEYAVCERSCSRTMAHDSTRPHSPYRRPSSHSMERVAARSQERLDRELREFYIWCVAENDKARFECDLADAKAKSLSQTAPKTASKPAANQHAPQASSSQQKPIIVEEDVEMPAAPAIVMPAEGTAGKGKVKGPSIGTGPTSSAVASTSAISSTSNGVNSTPNIEDLLIDMYMDPVNIALPEDNFGDFDELDFEGEVGRNLGLPGWPPPQSPSVEAKRKAKCKAVKPLKREPVMLSPNTPVRNASAPVRCVPVKLPLFADNSDDGHRSVHIKQNAPSPVKAPKRGSPRKAPKNKKTMLESDNNDRLERRGSLGGRRHPTVLPVCGAIPLDGGRGRTHAPFRVCRHVKDRHINIVPVGDLHHILVHF